MLVNQLLSVTMATPLIAYFILSVSLVIEVQSVSIQWAPTRQKQTHYNTIRTLDQGGGVVRTIMIPTDTDQNTDEHEKLNYNDDKYKYVDFNQLKNVYKEHEDNFYDNSSDIYENNRLFYDFDDQISDNNDNIVENSPNKWDYYNLSDSNFDNRFNIVKYSNPVNNDYGDFDDSKYYSNVASENNENNHNPLTNEGHNSEDNYSLNNNNPTINSVDNYSESGLENNKIVTTDNQVGSELGFNKIITVDNVNKIDIRNDEDLDGSETFGFKYVNGTLWRVRKWRRRRPTNEIVRNPPGVTVGGGATQQGDGGHPSLKDKLAKFLNLFTVIKFSNEPCLTSDGIKGTCYHHMECRSMGGQSGGPCAHGYGVCCVSHSSCGARTSQNTTYFVSQPASVTSHKECTLLVDKADPHVTQVRLDFVAFELKGPTAGTCVDDQFIVSGQNRNNIVPVLCGVNTGQHVYLDWDESHEPIRLSVLSQSPGRQYRIKVTQLHRGDELAAPRNCLQFYRGASGTVESFNYQHVPGGIGTRSGYLNNLNYAICIRKEANYCSVTYANAGVFQIINVDADGVSLIDPRQAGVETFNCPDDYIVVNGLRLCGERLNDASTEVDFTKDAPVIDNSNGPFTIAVRTNGNIVGRGFRIAYKQHPC